MLYLYIKALHIIFIVTWFAGLFYVVRLFIYFVEANDRPVTEKSVLQSQYNVMISRLWSIITVPSMVLTVVLGSYLMIVSSYYHQTWMLVKLGLVIFLLTYHFLCGLIKKQLSKGVVKYTSNQMRAWNEVATLLLFSIIFMVELKDSLNMLAGVLGLLVLAVLLMLGIRFYKKYRERR
jgi:putative membrane protein